MEIRDPVHGFICVPEDELKIVNTPVFQRLRRIRQLAMAHLVYPGATHTRFEHSLGSFHVATKMAGNLLRGKENERRRRIVRFAALLHDLGQGPFSHVSDDVFELMEDSGLPASARAHEFITTKILDCDPDLQRIIGEDTVKDVISLIQRREIHPSVMHEIISGAFDVDKMDYLLRDSLFCGVKYGVFDLDRMLSTLTTCPGKIGVDCHLAVHEKGVNSLEQFVLARYFMTTQVYKHKIRSITDAMIARGIELGIDEGIDFLAKIYHYEDSPEYILNYLKWDDARLADAIARDRRKGSCSEMFTRLEERNLFKRVFRSEIGALEIGGPMQIRVKNISLASERELRKEFEATVSRLSPLGCRPEHVIAKCLTFGSAKETVSGAEGELLVLRTAREPDQFSKASAVFRSINETNRDQFLEVYAPLDFEGREKEKAEQKIEHAIIQLLLEMEKNYGD
ncbi:MAG: HD domain-containing protein [Candidatus Coatesbacteria bacterium]|nr:HD domain-containing protein [Candidatus Coatesbacteria bacterium]